MKHCKQIRQNTRRHETARKYQYIRSLEAINNARQGSGYISAAAARAEGTTLAFIKHRLPKAIYATSSAGRLRVRPSDPYPELVEILTETGDIRDVPAFCSSERHLAGLHKAACNRVLMDRKASSILRRFRNKTVGDVKLLTSPALLFDLWQRLNADLYALYGAK
jgi:hypothetical protein